MKELFQLMLDDMKRMAVGQDGDPTTIVISPSSKKRLQLRIRNFYDAQLRKASLKIQEQLQPEATEEKRKLAKAAKRLIRVCNVI